MSNGLYDLSLGSEILILAGDIRSRSWLNIGGTYSIFKGTNELALIFSLIEYQFFHCHFLICKNVFEQPLPGDVKICH